MTRPCILFAALAALALPAAAQEDGAVADATADDAAAARPDGIEAAASDGLAECAAILAVASSGSSSRIERERLMLAAGAWFAISGDLAIAEGAPPADGLWEAKVVDWAGRISRLDGLTAHDGWAAYCATAGAAAGLDGRVFAALD